MTPLLTQIQNDVKAIVKTANEFGDSHVINGVEYKAIVHASGYSKDSKILSGIDDMNSVALIVMKEDMNEPVVGSVIVLDGAEYIVNDTKIQGVGAWRASLQRIEG